jgi:TRAP-type C4-dicarboxylate transport system permease small subunit
LKTFKARLDLVAGGLLAGLMAVAVLAVLWQVASRYLLGAPSGFTDELVRFLLIWIGLVGGAYAAGQKQHMAVDLLVVRFPPAWQHRLERLAHLLVLLFALVVMVYGGSRLVQLEAELGQRSAALGLPLAQVYLALPLGGLLLALYSLAFLAGTAGPAGKRPEGDV